jgi:putative flippase GtrA
MIGERKNRTIALFITLCKAQVSSLIATGVDWILTFSLTQWFGTWYVASTIVGATTGGVTNFILNRNWTFNTANCRKDPIYRGQIIRYALVWLCSIALNTLGTIFLTEVVLFNYMVSKIITAITVAISFNYFMQKNYVFRYTV